MADLSSAAVPPLTPDDHARGPESGPPVLFYGDFTCVHCAVVATRLRDLPLRVSYRHIVLGARGQRSLALACAAEAAAEQGAFWALHDSLFADQGHQDDPHLWTRCNALGIDLERFEHDRRTDAVSARVREQTKAAAHVAQLLSQVRAGEEHIRGAEAERTRGSDVILRSAAAMRDVAQQVRVTTQEQARGSTRIRDTTEGVRETTERINEALQQQSQACGEVARFLERVQGRTGANDAAAERMGEAVASLARQAETLREGTKRFRL